MSADTTAEAFATAGYGGNPVGFGRKTAVVVVDFQLGFTDPAYRMGRSPYTQAAVETASETLKQARALGVPVLHTVVEYGSLADVGNWKTRGLEEFTPGSEVVKVDPRVWAEGDVLVKKHFPSAFFGTDTASILRFWDVDTVVVMGCTTSGCIRATVIDSFSHGFRTIVAEDCCGDHDPATHASNLQDVERRYADVLTAAEILAQLTPTVQPAPAADLIEV
ncbi:N-carbamoylsarcosine amidohydrolase [Arthrobacter ginkgonis]|uniref:N-carbamoylsarcosine amidohydrolase n=1 Tax=Arthrobacter ginkgonis TaxID=1630594 RepID=A0ABP7DC05_9MICC